MIAPTNDDRDTVLDFLRGISVLMVVVSHLIGFRLGLVDGPLLAVNKYLGTMGVHLFFIISGFIITKLLLEEEARRGAISIWSFYIRRAWRILPPFIVYAASVIAFGALGWIAFETSSLPYALGFLCNVATTQCGWFLLHTWSLSVEEQFYLAWPLLFLLIGMRYRALFLSLSFIAFTAVSAVHVFTMHGISGPVSIDIPLSFSFIAIGALYATSRWFRGFLEKRCLVVVIGILCIIAASYVALGASGIFYVIYRLLQPLLFVGAVSVMYRFFGTARSPAFRFVAGIGLMSYSLYLWQQVFLAPPGLYVSDSFLQIPILMFPIAFLSYRFVEQPLTRWARSHATRSP